MTSFHYQNVPSTSLALSFILLSSLIMTLGCDREFDHEPPVGQGSIIIDNNTGGDLDVYMGGAQTNDVDTGDNEAYDLPPGLYRVVIDEEDGTRSWADDVDVLEDRLTILKVYSSDRSQGLEVSVSFDDP